MLRNFSSSLSSAIIFTKIPNFFFSRIINITKAFFCICMAFFPVFNSSNEKWFALLLMLKWRNYNLSNLLGCFLNVKRMFLLSLKAFICYKVVYLLFLCVVTKLLCSKFPFIPTGKNKARKIFRSLSKLRQSCVIFIPMD